MIDICSNHGAWGKRHGDESTNTLMGKWGGGDLGKESQRLWSWQKQIAHSTEALTEVRPRLLTEYRECQATAGTQGAITTTRPEGI